MPRGDEVERPVGRSEASAVEDTGEPIVAVAPDDEQVERGEVAMTHDVGPGCRQHAQRRPELGSPTRVEQVSALREALRDPLVVIGEMTAATGAVEHASADRDAPQRRDERHEVAGERSGCRVPAVPGHLAVEHVCTDHAEAKPSEAFATP